MKQIVNWTAERKLFRAVTETTSLIAWATDIDGRCFYLSPGWFKFTGAEEDHKPGFDWMNAVHPEDVVKVCTAFFNANDTRTAYGMSFRLVRADGEYVPVWDVGLPKFDDDGDFQGFYGTVCVIEQHHSATEQAPMASISVLTEREREILKLISHGNTSDTVAAMLGIAGRTVDAHIANAGAKLGASNRIHAVATALRLLEI